MASAGQPRGLGSSSFAAIQANQIPETQRHQFYHSQLRRKSLFKAITQVGLTRKWLGLDQVGHPFFFLCAVQVKIGWSVTHHQTSLTRPPPTLYGGGTRQRRFGGTTGLTLPLKLGRSLSRHPGKIGSTFIKRGLLRAVSPRPLVTRHP